MNEREGMAAEQEQANALTAASEADMSSSFLRSRHRQQESSFLTASTFTSTISRWERENEEDNGGLLPTLQVSNAEELQVGTCIRDGKTNRRARILEASPSSDDFLVEYEEGAKDKKPFSWAEISERFYLMVEVDDVEKDQVLIPSWSLQDRMERYIVVRKLWVSVFGSNLLIALAYIIVFLIPSLCGRPYEGIPSACITSAFIIWQIPVTLIQAIPDEDTFNEEVNNRVNATILVAMTLYPCFGLWILNLSYEQGSVWDLMNFDNFWNAQDAVGRYQWGYIFPFFLWSTSACLLLRDSNFAFTMDREGVCSENGKRVTALYRRYPSILEVGTHRVTRALTFSLWTVLPDHYRPASKAGRFVFQFISPVVVMFLYVGFRFIVFSGQEMSHIIHDPDDFTRLSEAKDSNGTVSDGFIAVAMARVIVWSVFTIYCIIIRSVIGQRDFLARVVRDSETVENRWVSGWSSTIVESKRARVLWAFRGLTNAAVPYYVLRRPDREHLNFLDWIAWYLYLGVYISFLMEGVGAIWFGLVEAERNCHLVTPFSLFKDLSFWGAFNMYLQPLGTAVNAIVFCLNGEYKEKLALREIWSPLLLNRRNHFRKTRLVLPISMMNDSSYLPKSITGEARLPAEAELEERRKEWEKEYDRKRSDAGRKKKSVRLVEPSEGDQLDFAGRQVFRGTMFPTREEWIYMRNRYDEYVTLHPWEQVYGPEKFLQWYPTYREKIISLLREPYDFNVRREVWMFGYGSLISPDCPPHGLTETQRKLIIPYWLKKQAGYRRTWNYRHGSCGVNAFALESTVDKTEGMNICGCVYPIDYQEASNLFSFREEGYELHLIHERYFEPMHKDFELPKGIGYLWVCGQPTSRCKDKTNEECAKIDCKWHVPTQDSPILQSYIDLVLEGALRYRTAGKGHVDGMNFAAAILSSTVGWKYPWYNDRQLSGRPWYLTPKYELIDGLLSTSPTSRDAFVNRLRTSMELLSEKHQMLEDVKDSLSEWSDTFYRPARWASDRSRSVGHQWPRLSMIASETS